MMKISDSMYCPYKWWINRFFKRDEMDMNDDGCVLATVSSRRKKSDEFWVLSWLRAPALENIRNFLRPMWYLLHLVYGSLWHILVVFNVIFTGDCVMGYSLLHSIYMLLRHWCNDNFLGYHVLLLIGGKYNRKFKWR